MGDKMHNLGANQACFIPCQRSIWTPLLQVHLRGCGHVVSWERCQHLSDFVPCSNLLAVYIAYLGWAELLAEISGLFGLEPNIFEVTLLIYKDCAHSPFAHPSRTWLLLSQLHGAVWTVAVPHQTVFAALRQCLVLLFSFVFIFWLFYFFPEHTALCRALPWQTTLPTGAVHKTLPVTLHRACNPPDQSLWINITSR